MTNYGIWRTGPLVLTMLLLLGVSQAGAQQTDAASAAAPAAPAAPDDNSFEVTHASSRLILQNAFPRLKDFVYSNPPVSVYSPVEQKSEKYVFGIAKLSLVVAAILLWLKGLQLYASNRDDSAPAQSRMFKLFLIGMVGIMMGLFLPAYLPGLGLLLVTSSFPLWLYSRHSHRNSGPSASVTSQSPIFHAVVDGGPDAVAPNAFLAGQKVNTEHATIQLIGKSPLALESNNGISRGAQAAPAFQHVLALIDHAVFSRATDLHVSAKTTQVELRQRVDGSLISLGVLPLELGYSLINVFKVMSDLNIADRRRSQDGSFLADVNNRRLSFRVSSQGTQTGETLSIRILDPAKSFCDLSTIGMSPTIKKRFSTLLQRNNGLILFAGTTGAGKSTAACASLQTIDSTTRSIVSIEDPIEYQIPGVDQIEVNIRAGQTFQSALRSVLRLDADVIFIGEVRDEETAKIACRAAQAGQLVLATLHANDAVSGAIRLLELGLDPQSIANSLRAVVAQSLVRKLCVDCRQAYTPDASLLEQLGIPGFEGELYRSPDPSLNDCPVCDRRGFIRRTGVFELLEITPPVRDLIHSRAPSSQMSQVARENGMSFLREDGVRLVREGIISVEELERVMGPS